MCGLKVKYLKESITEEGQRHLEIMNKVIRLTTLKESSNAKTMNDIVKNKFFISDQIKENLIGLTHDNASALSSEENGLAGMVKKNSSNFIYDLCNPCHCLNLCIKHSLDILPKEVLSFVDNIHHHFAFPQRKAALRRIQEENNMEVLLLKEYGKTRWLSLGLCIERLLKIWPSLKLYSKDAIKNKTLRKKVLNQLKKIDLQLNNQVFKLKIQMLSYIINQTNKLSTLLQNQSFNLGELRKEMKICFQILFKLICLKEKFDTDFEDFLRLIGRN